KASIRGEDDASRAFKGVRRAFLAADWLELSRTSTTGEDALDLGDCAARRPGVMNDAVPNFVGLHVEMSTMLHRHTHVFRHTHLFRLAHLLRHARLLFRLLVMRVNLHAQKKRSQSLRRCYCVSGGYPST